MVSLKTTLYLLGFLTLGGTSTARLSDGVYTFSINEAGDEIFDKIGVLQPMPGIVTARDTTDVKTHLYRRNAYKCFTITLSKNDIGTAAYNLGRTCGKSSR